jgi:hypothetical protein
MAGNVDSRRRRLGSGRGRHRLSSPGIAMAGRPHNPSDPGSDHDCRGATRDRRRGFPGHAPHPARGRLVLLHLSLALADLGLRAELAIPARIWRGCHAKKY